jgi:uncharacterized membrane protein
MDHLVRVPFTDGMTSLTRTLTIGTAVGSGVVGGVLFGFSTFVMRALDRLPATQAMAAMQSINREAPNPLFMAALFGTAAAGLALGITALPRLDEPAAKLQLTGSVLYLAAVAVTAIYHVPHNDALAKLDPSGASGTAEWVRYSSGWTAWNHVRTATAIGASVVLTIAAGIR